MQDKSQDEKHKKGEMTFAERRDGERWLAKSSISCGEGGRRKQEKETPSRLVLQETDKVGREINPSNAVIGWRVGSSR